MTGRVLFWNDNGDLVRRTGLTVTLFYGENGSPTMTVYTEDGPEDPNDVEFMMEWLQRWSDNVRKGEDGPQ